MTSGSRRCAAFSLKPRCGGGWGAPAAPLPSAIIRGMDRWRCWRPSSGRQSPDMIVVLLQFVAVVVAGVILWRGWRAVAPDDSRARLITALGLLLRAFGAQALFWISWLRLPV